MCPSRAITRLRACCVVQRPPGCAVVAGLQGVSGRAHERGAWSLHAWNPRDHAEGAYRSIDDRPFGGGPGMVMMAEPLARTLDAIATIARGLLRGPAPELEAARTLRDHLAADDDPDFPLVRCTARLVAAGVAAAEGNDGEAARLAREAAELAASVEAPWWRLCALEIDGDPSEVAALSARLGISGARGSNRVPARPRDG